MTTHYASASNATVFRRWAWFDCGGCFLSGEYLLIAPEDGDAHQVVSGAGFLGID